MSTVLNVLVLRARDVYSGALEVRATITSIMYVICPSTYADNISAHGTAAAS